MERERERRRIRLCLWVLRRVEKMGKTAPESRVAFILVDGLGDVGVPALGWRSPVEAAVTPNLDAIASAGVNGLMDPVEPGLACGSDTAHLSLLGYNPRIYYRGRGSFESLGAGLAMVPGDIAFKVCVYSFIWLFLCFFLFSFSNYGNM